MVMSLIPERIGVSSGVSASSRVREVDVHVGDDLRVTSRPRGAKCPTSTLLGEMDECDIIQRCREPHSDEPGAVVARVVDDSDACRERDVRTNVRTQHAHTLFQGAFLVVDGNRDVQDWPDNPVALGVHETKTAVRSFAVPAKTL